MNDNPAMSAGPSPDGTQVYRIDIVADGTRSEYCVDLTRVGATSDLNEDGDLAARLDLLVRLRDWLEIHGALTPGSGVLVRAVPNGIHPEDLAEEMQRGGTILDTRWVETTIRAEDTSPVGM